MNVSTICWLVRKTLLIIARISTMCHKNKDKTRRVHKLELYPPLSTSFMSLSPSSLGNLIFGLLISGISSCLTSLNFWTTILNLRSYYLTLKTMPLFPWALLITGGMLLLTLPILSGALWFYLYGILQLVFIFSYFVSCVS